MYPLDKCPLAPSGIYFGWGLRLGSVRVDVLRRATISYELSDNKTSV